MWCTHVRQRDRQGWTENLVRSGDLKFRPGNSTERMLKFWNPWISHMHFFSRLLKNITSFNWESLRCYEFCFGISFHVVVFSGSAGKAVEENRWLCVCLFFFFLFLFRVASKASWPWWIRYTSRSHITAGTVEQKKWLFTLKKCD